MENLNVIEGNKLIAEFMGWSQQLDVEKRWYGAWFDQHKVRKAWSEFQGHEPLLFNESWDWLMPVVEKISRIPSHYSNGLYKYLCHVDLNPIKGITIEGMYKRNFNAKDEIFIQIYEYSYLENTWLGVVEFIKWYNQQETKNNC